MLLRDEEAPEVVLRRGGRSLVVPAGKPVVMLDQDRLELGGRQLRVHVHGQIQHSYEPTPLVREEQPLSGTGGRVAAAALALGTAVGAVGCSGAETQRGRAAAAAGGKAPGDAGLGPRRQD